MPEVPENIQENLAHMDLNANGVQSPTGAMSPPAHFPGRGDSLGIAPAYPSVRLVPQGPQQAAHYQPGIGRQSMTASHHQGYHGYTAQQDSVTYNVLDQPSFSPFPKLHNPPPNVPPSDEEKEATLEQARMPVLNSGDAEMQLAWAQDTLAYVEISMQLELRLSEHQPARPQTPQVEHQLREDAVNIVRFLAEQHHPKAEFMKGMWLEFGKFGFRVDKKEAFRSYARAADKGYARAEYRMGMQFESSNDPVKAIKHYNQGVARGDSASNYRLGMMILLGQHGQQQDYKRGLDHIRYAAETADENAPQGAYVYGMLLARELESIHVPEYFLPFDINEARANIEKAAYLGFAKAQVKMGAAYELCQLGCDFNPALSLHYNALAARQGEAVAEMAVSKWFLCGYEGIFEKNEELAFVYAKRAAHGGLPTAEFAMGYFYEIGMFVSANMDEARRWYEIAAGHGNKDAVGRIEGISRSKTLSKKDHERVAIQKIKSQYGSQKGRRPARFQAAPEPLPSIPDDQVAMPDPSSPQQPMGANYFSHVAGVLPPRSQSAAPYPLEDGPPRMGPRPGSTAGVALPTVRPSSAFGLNPHLRPSTVSPAGANGSRPAPHHANTASARLSLNPSPGGDYYRRQRTGPSNGQVPPSLAHAGGTPHETAPPAASKPVAARLDIGFSAPPEPTVDKRSRLQKPQTPVNHKPQPSLPQFEQDFDADQDPARQYRGYSKPPPQAVDPRMRPMSAQSGSGYTTSTRPPRSRPETVEPPSMPKSGPSTPAPAQQPPTKAAVHPAAVQPRPPGKGPKTFEEMGVAQATKESECVSVVYPHLVRAPGSDAAFQTVM